MVIQKNQTDGDNSPIFNNTGDAYQQVFISNNQTINPFNLRKVIGFIEIELESENIISDPHSINIEDDLKRINIEEKNRVNKLEDENSNLYFENIIESSIYFKSIKEILSNPRNKDIKKSYNNIRKTIRNKIPEIKEEQVFFYQVLNEVIDRFLNSNDPILLENEEMVSVIIHFMYYICHIGENNVETR